MRYLFYNIYGDANNLLATKPNDVTPVPFGWDPQTEANRNQIISQLNCVVSCLPSLIYYRNEYTIQMQNSLGEIVDVTIPAHWEEIRVGDMEKPWTWEKIQEMQK